MEYDKYSNEPFRYTFQFVTDGCPYYTKVVAVHEDVVFASSDLPPLKVYVKEIGRDEPIIYQLPTKPNDSIPMWSLNISRPHYHVERVHVEFESPIEKHLDAMFIKPLRFGPAFKWNVIPTDTIIVTGDGQQHKVHSQLLRAASPVFAELLKEEHRTLYLPSVVDGKAFARLMILLRGGQPFELFNRDLVALHETLPLWALAHYLEIEGLKEEAKRTGFRHFMIDTCVQAEMDRLCSVVYNCANF